MSAGHPSNVRQTMYERDDWTCQGCGFHQTDEARRRVENRGGGRYLTIDHIVPRSKGGSERRENLQVLCNVCNREKADALDPADAIPVRMRKRLRRSSLVARLHRAKDRRMLIHDPRCDAMFCIDTCPVYLEEGVFV